MERKEMTVKRKYERERETVTERSLGMKRVRFEGETMKLCERKEKRKKEKLKWEIENENNLTKRFLNTIEGGERERKWLKIAVKRQVKSKETQGGGEIENDFEATISDAMHRYLTGDAR